MVDQTSIKGVLAELTNAQQAILRGLLLFKKLNPLASSIVEYKELQTMAQRIMELSREIGRLRV